MTMALAFCFLVGATILSASIEGMHDHYCPPDDNYDDVIKYLCGTDDDCVSSERCCQSGKVVKCMKSWKHHEDVMDVKVGICIALSVREKKIPPNCRSHQDCPGKALCCEQRCISTGKAAPKAKEGFCPSTTRLNVTLRECDSDAKCPGKEKCCHFRGLITCVVPKVQMGGGPRKGKCPKKKEDDGKLTAYKLCNGDSDCFYQDKCCETSVSKRCFTPEDKKRWWSFKS